MSINAQENIISNEYNLCKFRIDVILLLKLIFVIYLTNTRQKHQLTLHTRWKFYLPEYSFQLSFLYFVF